MATAVRYNGPSTSATIRASDGQLYTCPNGSQITIPDDTAIALFAEGWTAPDGTTPGYTPPVGHTLEDVFLDNGTLSKWDTTTKQPTPLPGITGRNLGAYSSLAVGTVVKANDMVTNGGALFARIADGTISGAFNPAHWTSVAAGVTEAVNTVSAAGAAQTIPDVSTATVNRLTLTAATCTLTFPAITAGKSFTLVLAQDATGGRLVTWPATGLKWGRGNVAPILSTTPSKADVLSFMCADGTNWLGFLADSGF